MAEIDRLSQIVDELLSSVAPGSTSCRRSESTSATRPQRAVERWRGRPQRARSSWMSTMEARPRWPGAPRHDLDRPLDALVENALRYSPAGSGVTIAIRPGRLEILDRGPGLEPGEEDAVFDRFSRGSAGRSGPSGTGLGLAIARELTRQWGGEVTLARRAGGGDAGLDPLQLCRQTSPNGMTLPSLYPPSPSLASMRNGQERGG